jgi:predicted nucleic acid-binding protein
VTRRPTAGKPPSSAHPHASAPRLLIDTNVVLDLLLARQPWAHDAARLFDACAQGAAHAFLAAHAVTTIHYLVERVVSRKVANTAVSDLLEIMTVVPADSDDFRRALTLGVRDFEDAVHVTAFLRCGAQSLVTRNARDFKAAKIETRTAGETLALLGAKAKAPARRGNTAPHRS